MPEGRPDPDTLLKSLQAEETRATKGKLKLFLGYSPGVGKTYAMLEAARVRRAEGLEVCAGIVETHGRVETNALLEGLPLLPRRTVDYKGVTLSEFDLDAAIALKPPLVLVDELAHTNAPGSRHAKRWQDVEELLDRGISVYTTLNIQHMETAHDAVASVTGVIVHETVPDKLLERADEVELVDLPPVDLLKRLQAGKVYMPEAASRALGNFFKIENLTALREIALRALADRVNLQVEGYRESKSPEAIWPIAERLVVCVGPSPSSARLVRAAHRMASRFRAPWTAVFVDPPAWRPMTPADRERVSEHLRLAEKLGGDSAVLSGEDFAMEVISFARSRNATRILTGKPPRRLFPFPPSQVDRLIRGSSGIDILVTEGSEDDAVPPPPRARDASEKARGGWFFSLSVVAVSTLVAALMYHRFALSNLIMVYLLGTVVVSLRESKGPSILASFLSVLAYDFFFVPPRFTFAVADTQYLLTFAIMLSVSLVLSELTRRMRMQAEWARLREQRTSALFSLSQDLVAVDNLDAVVHLTAKRIDEVFDAEVLLLLPDGHGRLALKGGSHEVFTLPDKERAVAQWVFDLGRRAGPGTDTFQGADALYMPLNGVKGPVGVARIQARNQAPAFQSEQLNLLEAFAHLTALSLENEQLKDQAHTARVDAEGEKLRSSLLSSVSHDLRTPLAAILGSADSLLDAGSNLSPESRKGLLENIRDEAERLNRLLRNLLEMTRLSAGALKVVKTPQPLEEPIGSALARLGQRLADRKVTVQIPEDFPMVPVDGILIEQALFNLFENALKYTPAGCPLEVAASLNGNTAVVEVMDRGPGLAEGEEEAVFEKFHRGRDASGGGTGLGLAVAKGILEAHEGKLTASNRPGGGAAFRLELPLRAPGAQEEIP